MAERGIPFARARELVRDQRLRAAGAQAVPLGAGLVGRVLSEDVAVRGDHPPFTNSAMDGYALRAADAPGRLSVVGESRAGQGWSGTLQPCQVIVISTGAPLPDGADAIVPREQARLDGDVVEVPATEPGAFVREKGSDARAGDAKARVLEKSREPSVVAGEKFRILDYVDDLSKAQGKGMVHAGDVRDDHPQSGSSPLDDKATPAR